MTDVQVSNARRIGFTALAVVTFALLALRSYWMSRDYVYETLSSAFFSTVFIDSSMFDLALDVAGLMALAPMLFLSLSVSRG